MEETGVVKSLDGTKAFVSLKKQGGCEGCSAGSVCKSMSGGDAEIEALNSADAKAGDTVRIAFKSYSYMKGALLVYGIPMLFLMIGAVFGKEFLPRFVHSVQSDTLSALAGFGFFGLSFVIIKTISNRFDKKQELIPVIEEVIK
ncbi:MAG: SoxR reducing system RseC family protein [Nitrospirae bacterium]|nr:SoxR reducing system RseC family protein [Nitrospirota bacterium]